MSFIMFSNVKIDPLPVHEVKKIVYELLGSVLGSALKN